MSLRFVPKSPISNVKAISWANDALGCRRRNASLGLNGLGIDFLPYDRKLLLEPMLTLH